MLRQVIMDISKILNLAKGFEAGYGTSDFSDGYMLVIHNGTRYAVKITKIENPSENVFDDIRKLKYLV